MAAFFGAVSVSGQALHLLPGCDHAVDGRQPACACDGRQPACACDGRQPACTPAGEGTFLLGFLTGAEPSVRAQLESELGVCEGQNCLICHYWAQAKTLVAVLHLPFILPRCDDAPVAVVSVFSPLHRCLFECRGPPSLPG
jgi:hypothetical protein